MLKNFIGLLVVLIFGLSIGLNAQSTWARVSGGAGYEDVVSIAHHPVVGVVVAGHFNFQFSIGVYPFVTTGLSDVFVICHDDTGGVRWARTLGGPSDDRVQALAVSSSGDIWVTGSFTQSFQAGSHLLTCLGQKDVFLIKLNSSGQITAAYSFGGSGNEEAGDIAIDGSGNILMTGSYKGTAKFGNQTITSTVEYISQQPGADPFILSISPSGQINWLKTGISPTNDYGLEIETDANGNVYASGQCSDTIQFVQSYPNSAYNAIWLMKLSGNGTEVWFRTIAGSSKSILRGMKANASGDVFVGGEAGNSCLFAGTVNAVLNTPYPNAVFVARYTTAGQVSWLRSEGSVQSLDATSITLDSLGHAWISGTFSCSLSSLSAVYGSGRFRSTGYKDIWMAEYDASGQRIYAQQFGGQGNEEVVSMCDAGGRLMVAGHFDRRLIIPRGLQFKQYDGLADLAGITVNLVCADSSHGRFAVRFLAGGTDFFYGPCVDKSRDAYDYFGRQTIDCTFPAVPLCINSGADAGCKGDTIKGCGSVGLSAATNTAASFSGDTINTAGPFFNYLWSTGATSAGISTINDGSFIVTVISEDGCYTGTATAYAEVNPVPSIPRIADNFGINNNAFVPLPVRTCVPDTILLTPGNLGGNNFYWTANSLTYTDTVFSWIAVDADSFMVDLTVENSFGCTASNSVFIAADSLLPAIQPAIFSDDPDTLVGCAGSSVAVWISDLLTDSTGENMCGMSQVAFNWTSSPFINFIPDCGGQTIYLQVQQQGFFTLTCIITRSSFCGGVDSFVVSKTVYVSFAPPPVINPSISGAVSGGVICPGEIKTLTAGGGYFYSWSGPGVQMPYNNPALVVNAAGTYCVIVTDSSNLGCIASAMSCVTFTSPLPPVISSGEELICPGDSILITASGGASYDWYGPSGPLPDTLSSIYANEGGFYYVYVQDTAGCQLVSNAIELSLYSTPALYAQPVPVICNGTPITLQVATNPGSTISWLAPLNGSTTEQTISTPGVYQCSVTSCNITTISSIQIGTELVQATVSPAGPLTVCDNDSLELTASGAFPVYQWIPGNENGNPLVVTGAGSYAVFVISASGCTDTSGYVTVNTLPSPVAPSIIAEDSLCEQETLHLQATASGGVFSWSGPGGFSSNQLQVSIPNLTSQWQGWYTASINDGQCTSDTSVYIRVIEIPTPQISITGDACIGSSIELSAITGGGSLQWIMPDGSVSLDSILQTGPLAVGQSGWYLLQEEIFRCSGMDSVLIEVSDCDLSMPDVFSPNGDNINDLFGPIGGFANIQQLIIFNRWGDKVYESSEKGWDGRSEKGEELPAGTYFYLIQQKDGDVKQGQLLLFR